MKMNNQGQTLIMLLVFVVILMTVATGAVAVAITNSTGTAMLAQGEEVYHAAEAGADNAILRLLRNPNYSGEILPVGQGSAIITVSGGATKTITSQGVLGEFRRTIQVIGTYDHNVFSITSWQEID